MDFFVFSRGCGGHDFFAVGFFKDVSRAARIRFVLLIVTLCCWVGVITRKLFECCSTTFSFGDSFVDSTSDLDGTSGIDINLPLVFRSLFGRGLGTVKGSGFERGDGTVSETL